jgi:hypothetical protein
VALARATEVLVDDPGSVLAPRPTRRRVRRRQHHAALRIHLGAGASVHQDVLVRLGPPRPTDTGVALPIHWEPRGRRRLLPSFTGELSASGSQEGTAIQLNGTYTVPLGVVGALADRAIGRRLAQGSLDDFARRISARIETEVERRLHASPRRQRAALATDLGGPPEIYLG